MPASSPEKKPKKPGSPGSSKDTPPQVGSEGTRPFEPQATPAGSHPRGGTGLSQPSFILNNELPKISGYEILGEVGRGNMGVIYKARQQRLNRIVALKMIIAGKHADDTQKRRFETEAEAVARLHHPNIVQVYDIGEYEEQPFLVMEFVDGGSLDRRMRGRTLSPKTAAQLTLTLAKAMQAAHEAGIIHRDLKPGNILVTSKGVAKITDFGLAKKMDADTSATATGTILGTPSYMAPEQARSNKLPTTPATDVYGLGAILYEMITGRPPFREETFLDTMLQVVSAPPRPPSEINDKIPPELEAICLTCLAKDPTERFMTARQLADALTKFLTASSSATGQSGKLLDQPLLTGPEFGSDERTPGDDDIIDLATAPRSTSGSYIVKPTMGVQSLREQPVTVLLTTVMCLVFGGVLAWAIATSEGRAFALVTLPLALCLPFITPTPLGIFLAVLLASGSIVGSLAIGTLSQYPLLAPGIIGVTMGGVARLVSWLMDRRPIHCLLGAFGGLVIGFLGLFLMSAEFNVAKLSTWQTSTYTIPIVVITVVTMTLGAFVGAILAPKRSL